MTLVSCYLHTVPDETDATADHNVLDCMEVERFIADIQLVGDSSAAGTHGLLKKQFASLGCKSWDRSPRSGVGPIDIYGYTSDRGSDQAAVRKIMHAQTQDDPSCLFADWDCAMHATQLVVKSGMDVLNRFMKQLGFSPFFSAVAKFINVWRDNFWSVRREFLGISLDGTAAFAQKLPLRCLAGRWGSIFRAEVLLDDAAEFLRLVMPKAVSKRAAHVGAPAEVVDEDLREDAQGDYRRRQGRWSRDIITLCGADSFWIVLRIARLSHTLTDAIMLKCNQYSLHRTRGAETVNDVCQKPGLIFELVNGLSDKFMGKFNDMFAMSFEEWKFAVQMAPTPALIGSLNELIVLLNLNHMSNYHRRIHVNTQRFPFKLMQLAVSLRKNFCAARQGMLWRTQAQTQAQTQTQKQDKPKPSTNHKTKQQQNKTKQ